MPLWGRFAVAGSVGFGTMDGDTITIHQGDMFAGAKATGETLLLADVKLLAPCEPTKMIALWNNFHALAAKMDMPEPEEPLYLLKGNNSFLGPDEVVRRPQSYDGKVVYEGELGIVIGQEWDNDVRIVLFVALKEGLELTDGLTRKIKDQVRANCTPRHVPAVVVQVADIPRTKSGKITELAVRDIVHGREVKNLDALANPEALELYRELEVLRA